MEHFFGIKYYKCSFLLFAALVFGYCNVSAKILETTEITETSSSIEESTLVLFDLDDTLMDSAISLNSGKWIKFYWQTAPKLVPDQVPLLECLIDFVNEHVPVKPIDSIAPRWIQELQKKEGIIPLAITARSLEPMIAAKQLKEIGIDFSQTNFPLSFIQYPSFHSGIIFTSGEMKGEHIIKLLKTNHFWPKKVIFIDDKLHQVQSVDRAMEEAGICCDCFWYRRAEQQRPDFNPRLALIQLHYLLHERKVISEEYASLLEEAFAPHEIESLLLNLIKQFETKYWKP